MKPAKFQIALVTGSNKGIGEAIATGLAAEGYTVLITSRSLAKAVAVAQRLTQDGGKAYGFELDVTNEEAVDHFAQQILNQFGQVDILVNNAGIALDQWVQGQNLDLDYMRETFAVNVFAPLHLIQKFLPQMKKQAFGRIVNVSSELGSLETMEMAGTVAYRSSKTALNAVTKLLALEIEDGEDIQINAACPGWVKTALGGPEAPRSPKEGADTALWLATQPKNGPNGKLFRDRSLYPW
ncbi:SDR family oxidoreductase [Temperatibacter marinus]|uniref:SDR family oxidoreductase n=1 Tax=Temperatibacter marinus TaxID=1456591 RepID=A0AA52EI12_9PROT|nr:SDR family oxidoreductase [Temperatibacter marinus]WND03543.1 SDR family oxidoreductase [Temperatibacter marinus]